MSKSLVKQSVKSVEALLKEMGVVRLSDTDTHRHRMDIRSESSDKIYRVSQRTSNGSMQWECSCLGWITRRKCKHLTAMMPVLEALASSKPAKAIAASAPKKLVEHKPVKKETKVVSHGGIEAEPKDIKRMEDIVTKSNGDEGKMLALCIQMAKSITDASKAQRRAVAAKEVLPKSIAKKAYDIFWQD